MSRRKEGRGREGGRGRIEGRKGEEGREGGVREGGRKERKKVGR